MNLNRPSKTSSTSAGQRGNRSSEKVDREWRGIHPLVKHFNGEFFRDPSKMVFGSSPLYNVFNSINSVIDGDAAKKIGYSGCRDVARTS
ncbi:MAG: hypothetical protein KIH01_08340 [Candidatus Freyarchaeota archaeon]|nr:hypothetical protein [Candidatus Jordarchaeia archaeon]